MCNDLRAGVICATPARYHIRIGVAHMTLARTPQKRLETELSPRILATALQNQYVTTVTYSVVDQLSKADKREYESTESVV